MPHMWGRDEGDARIMLDMKTEEALSNGIKDVERWGMSANFRKSMVFVNQIIFILVI